MRPKDQRCKTGPKRRKKGGPYCALALKDDCQEDSSGELINDGNRWRRYDNMNRTEEIRHSRSYVCTNPQCSMVLHLEEASLCPEKYLITYEGIHTHGHLPPPYVTPDATRTYIAPTGQELSLEEFIESLKPVFGIFLTQPSKMGFWNRDYHADSSLMNSFLPQSSSNEGPDQASFPINNVVQSPLHSNGFYNPHLQMQQENAQYFIIHDSELGASVGDRSFPFNADVRPNVGTLQSSSSFYPNLGAATTEDTQLLHQVLDDSLQFDETPLSFFNDWDIGAYEDNNVMQHQLQEGQNAGNHNAFIPLTYEQTSTNWVAGGGDINSGVQRIVPLPLQLPYTHQYAQVSDFMPPSHRVQHIVPLPSQLPYTHQYARVSDFMPPSHRNWDEVALTWE